MDQSYIDLFDEKDIIEDNVLQTILTGSKKNTPDQLVSINKFKKNSKLNIAFKELLANSLQHLLHIEENEDEIILVTEEIEGESLSLYLNFSTVTEENRFDYLYEYLHQAIAYIGFENFLLNILIDQHQVTFKNNNLFLKEYITLDHKIDDGTPFSLVSKKIGITMNKILTTNFDNVRTSDKYKDIIDFSEQLFRSTHSFTSIDDIFTAYKSLYFETKLSRKGLLLGDMHPNNMLYDNVEEIPTVTEENKVIDTEVTSEEREMLTGIFTENSNDAKQFEESIDLSKLSEDTSSLEELVVENQEEVTYGVPDSLKDPSYQTTINTDSEDESESKSKKSFNPMFIVVPLVVLLITLGALLIPKLINPDTGEPQRPTASFDIEIEGNKLFCTNLSKAYNNEEIVSSYWVLEQNGVKAAEETGSKKANFDVSGLTEATYRITLIVTDSLGRFSEPYTIEKLFQSSESKALENQLSNNNLIATNQDYSNSSEILDKYELSTTLNVVEDYSIKYSGEKSLKIDLIDNNGVASLSFENAEMGKKSTVSFWLMSNKKEPITLNLIGYKDDTNIFSKEILYSPTALLSWNAFSTQLTLPDNSTSVNKLVIRFTSPDSVIWFDDITIKSFK